MTEHTPEIDSFIIRFVHSHPEDVSAHLRGSVRHIQSNEEISFTKLDELVEFLQRFVPLNLYPPS